MRRGGGADEARREYSAVAWTLRKLIIARRIMTTLALRPPSITGTNGTPPLGEDPATKHVLLLGAATPLGQQLLLKLAAAGYEVFAHLGDGESLGDSIDLASDVVGGSIAAELSSRPPRAVVAAAPLTNEAFHYALSSLPASPQVWLQCAPRMDRSACTRAQWHVQVLESHGLVPQLVRHTPCFADLVARFSASPQRPLFLGREAKARFNPVHEGEVAGRCVAALAAGDRLVDVGGPEVLTMCEAARRIRRAHECSPWILCAPPWGRRDAGVIAPAIGRRALDDYLQNAGPAPTLSMRCAPC